MSMKYEKFKIVQSKNVESFYIKLLKVFTKQRENKLSEG